ncbi:unnamed protein product [Darwinula stevensoni]|uniref:Uncharacterized protein n=1 Tax=Darwinula stevensoni TaxID=69355 RepID=A0A7R9A9V4_9CRUS|nr:unnamed protein product [Darwinula stevensoni]CAG0897712.1 unnamed protein product [Darwinula stevensoni]
MHRQLSCVLVVRQSCASQLEDELDSQKDVPSERNNTKEMKGPQRLEPIFASLKTVPVCDTGRVVEAMKSIYRFYVTQFPPFGLVMASSMRTSQ